MKNRIRKAVAVVLLSAFTVTCTVPAFATEVNNLQNQQQQINAEKAGVQSQIKEIKREKTARVQELNKLNSELNSVQQALDTINAEIASTEEQIAFTEMEINNKQRDYDGRMAIFNLRLKEMYQYGEVNFLEVLLQSSSLSDFLTRFEYLKYIANNDKKLLDEVTVLKNGLEEQKKSLDSMKVSLEANKKNQMTKSAELATASQAQQQLVNQINSDLNAQFEILEDLEAESKAIASQIAAIQAKNKGTTSAPGAYLWPAPSSRIVTSEYGYRIHPIQGTKKLHTGMDIGAKSGSNVIASAGGTVIMSQYYGGYGNCIIIDHGGGVSTLYAHMSKLIAKNGQYVNAGDVIGLVGSTGNSTGPHLHFEVRINGNTQNPRNYV